MNFDPHNKRKQRGQGITKLSDLFQKYKDTLKAPEGSVIEAFSESVFEIIGIRIERGQCSYSVSTKTLSVRAPGPVKSEIKLQKKLILAKMEERLGTKSVPKEIL